MKYKKYLVSLVILFPLLTGLLLSCSPNGPVAGGSGSTTTNGFTATVIGTKGDTVKSATVHIRPSDYCAKSSDLDAPAVSGTVADTFSDNSGTIAKDNMQPGLYTIEVLDEVTSQAIVFQCEIADGPVNKMGTLILKPVGAISGALDAELLDGAASFGVQVYGMERLARIDPATGSFFIENLPPTSYTLRLVSTDSTFEPQDLDPVAVVSEDTVTINPHAAWNHTAILTFKSTEAGLSADDTLYHFPLLLRLNKYNFDFTTAKKKGEDFRITKTDGSVVQFECERWDSTNATAAIWVLIDTLTGSKPEHTLQLYWGNSKGKTVSKPAAVFDTGAGLTGVWHLNNSGGKDQDDATANNRSGIPNGMDGSDDVDGIIGRAQNFEGDSQFIEFSALGNSTVATENFSVSLWVKAGLDSTSSTANGKGVLSGLFTRYGILFNGTNRWVFHDSESPTDSCTGIESSSSWILLTGVKRGARNYLYINGTLVDSSSGNSAPLLESSTSSNFRIGSMSNSSNLFTGTIDELRLYRHALSPKWIQLCHATQREQQSVVTIR